jgi:hypothetical protein
MPAWLWNQPQTCVNSRLHEIARLVELGGALGFSAECFGAFAHLCHSCLASSFSFFGYLGVVMTLGAVGGVGPALFSASFEDRGAIFQSGIWYPLAMSCVAEIFSTAKPP